ncbi:MAG: beta strand repeat-containing protein [Candidatus Porifericomitaceae bacterium WSBS_2022_MAG_OTU9]
MVLDSTASIDASAATGGGGEVLIGGGWQGGDDSIRNAVETEVKAGAIIKANANIEGDGGTIVVWSDGTTRYAGHLEATGGELAGAGGEAEVSGKENLLLRGTADLRAPKGKAGHLLLDPGTVRICAGAMTGCTNDPTGAPLNTFTDDYIETQLGNSDLSIMTSAATNGMVEDITVDSGVSINWQANRLTLSAGNDINLLGGTFTGGGALAFDFGNMLSLGGSDLSGVGSITATGNGGGTLAGPAGDTAWTINSDSVTVGGIAMTLSMVNILQGGAGDDTFTVSGSSPYGIYGGAGNNVFSSPGGLWVIDGTSISVGEAPYNLRGIDSLAAIGVVDNTFTVSGVVDYSIDGGAGFDTLSSEEAVWDISGAVVEVGGVTYTLSSVESFASGDVANIFTVSGVTTYDINGGAGADIFTINDGGSVAFLSGGDGIDVMSYANRGDAIFVTLSGLSIDNGVVVGFNGVGTSVGGFTGIDEIRGGSAGSDVIGGISGGVFSAGTLSHSVGGLSGSLAFSGFEVLDVAGEDIVGTDVATTWRLDGNILEEVIGGIVSRTLMNVGSVQGGTAVDTFEVTGEPTFDVALRGGDGADVFTVATILMGSIIGEDGADVFNVNSGGMMFGSIDGGIGDDTFNINGMIDGDVLGGAGNNVLSSAAAVWLIDGASITVDGAATYRLSNIASLTATGDVDNTFTVSGTIDYSIDGGAGDDVFTAAGTVWTVAGDTVTIGTLSTTLMDVETLQAALGEDNMFTVGGGSGYSLDGNGGSDVLLSEGTVWTVAGGMVSIDGTAYSLVGPSIGTLRATSNVANTFTVSGTIDYSIDGGAGDDTLASVGAAWDVSGAAVTVGGAATYRLSNIASLAATANVDNTFTVSGTIDYSIDGGAGDDVFTAAGTAWTVAGDTVTIGTLSTTLMNVETLQAALGEDNMFTVGGGSGYSLDGNGGSDVLLSAHHWTVAGGMRALMASTVLCSALAPVHV